VVATVQANRAQLDPFWNAARTPSDPARMLSGLASELERIVRAVLERIDPPARA
jgi:hypothetical protein